MDIYRRELIVRMVPISERRLSSSSRHERDQRVWMNQLTLYLRKCSAVRRLSRSSRFFRNAGVLATAKKF
jgi:hypothetical protein